MRFVFSALPMLCTFACDETEDSPELADASTTDSAEATSSDGAAALADASTTDSAEATSSDGAAALPADSGTADHPALSCADANAMLSTQASKLAVSLACTTDADCTTFTPDVRCGDKGTHLSLCPIAVTSSTREQVATAFGGVAEALCKGLVDACKGSPSCPAVVGKCSAQTCTVVRQP